MRRFEISSSDRKQLKSLVRLNFRLDMISAVINFLVDK